MPGYAVVRRRRVVRAKRTVKRGYRKSLTRSVGRTQTRRGPRPKFLFHRWAVNIPAYSSVTQASGLNYNSAQCNYNASTSVLSFLGTAGTYTEWQCSLCFALSDLANIAEYQSLFDQYRLNAVLIQFKLVNVPENNQLPNGNVANYGNFYPTIWFAPDQDDNSFISVAALKEYEKVKHKVLRPNKELSFLLRPRPLLQQYGTATSTSYALQRRAPWVDIATGASSQTPHYGCKFAIDFEGISLAIQQGFQIKMNAKYYFQCKNVR